MFCENCGNRIDNSHKFCTKCGNSTTVEIKKNQTIQQGVIVSNDNWWQRLLKVAYIFLCLQILWIVPAVWGSNLPYCSTYSSYCSGSYSESFWYSVLAIVIFVFVTRLIKITVLYVAMGRKPEWKKEFKKLY